MFLFSLSEPTAEDDLVITGHLSFKGKASLIKMEKDLHKLCKFDKTRIKTKNDSIHLCESNMTICSPEAGNSVRGRNPRAVLPVECEHIVILPSL